MKEISIHKGIIFSFSLKTMMMLKKVIRFVFLILILFYGKYSFAQSMQEMPNEKGEVMIPQKGNFIRINELKNNERIALQNTMNRQFKIICGSPLLNPPIGFNIKVASGITPVSQFDNKERIQYYATFALHPLQKDKNSGEIKPSYASSSYIRILANNIDKMCFNTGYFYKICQDLKIPVFFQQFPVVKSSEDYEEINFRNYGFKHYYDDFPVRIIKKNDRPVFIPYTRKEFFQFLKKYYQASVTSNEKSLAETKNELKRQKEYVADPKNPKDMRDAYQKSFSKYENRIVQWENNIADARTLLNKTEDALNAMPPHEAGQTTYIDMNKKGSFLDQLTPPGRQEGKALSQINPDYFDRNLPPSMVQLLVVTHEFHKTFSSDFIKKKVQDVFNSIDYQELKMSMK